MTEKEPELLKFREAKSAEIAALLQNPPKFIPEVQRRDFLASLQKGQQQRGLGIIAEYKRASPSLGDINLLLTPLEAARAYAEAEAISVLTEEKYFKGHLSYLAEMAQSGCPLLRKDFIFHPRQIEATAATAASAILLIVRLTPDVQLLRELINLAKSLALAPVVEVFDPEDLALARQAGADIIQVNARDLETLQVSSLRQTDLIRQFPPQKGEFWIAASGLSTAQDLIRVRQEGFGGVLLGTALMSSRDPAGKLKSLRAELTVNL